MVVWKEEVAMEVLEPWIEIKVISLDIKDIKAKTIIISMNNFNQIKAMGLKITHHLKVVIMEVQELISEEQALPNLKRRVKISNQLK